MKKITIFERSVLERTRFKKWRYKEITQYTILFDNKIIQNHDININNKNLKVKFSKILETSKKNELIAFYESIQKKRDQNSNVFKRWVNKNYWRFKKMMNFKKLLKLLKINKYEFTYILKDDLIIFNFKNYLNIKYFDEEKETFKFCNYLEKLKNYFIKNIKIIDDKSIITLEKI